MVVIGKTIPTEVTHPHTDIVTNEPSLNHTVYSSWGKAFLEKRLGTSLTAEGSTDAITLSPELLDRHTLIVGSSGGGKTRACEHIVAEQVRSGVSVVVIDPKFDTITNYLGRFCAMGIAPERITCLVPRLNAIPGWNPFASGIPIEQAVSAFVSLLAKAASSWGPRLEDILVNASLVIAAHRLSIYEILRFLVNDTYRARILRRTPSTIDPITYQAAREYFADEFDQWSKLTRAQAVAPVTNKCREFLRNCFLRSLMCPLRNTLSLSHLWHEQRIILVHLDEPLLGAAATRLLAGMLANSLFQTAMRTEGPHKVLLVLDELASLEKFVGTAICDICAIARSRGLRLLVACQHLAQLSDSLAGALLANCAIQLFFRVGAADSRLIGSSLAVTSDTWVKRIQVGLDGKPKVNEAPPMATWPHRILDAAGRPLGASPAAWKALLRSPSYTKDPLSALYQIANQCGKGRLYVRSADNGQAVELRQYCHRTSPSMIKLSGPTPLKLILQFPRFKAASIERVSESDLAREWARVLLGVPIQHCAIRLAGGRPQVVKVVNVPNAPAPPRHFVTAAIKANCQSPQEMEAALRARTTAVERLTSNRPLPHKGDDDGSIV